MSIVSLCDSGAGQISGSIHNLPSSLSPGYKVNREAHMAFIIKDRTKPSLAFILSIWPVFSE